MKLRIVLAITLLFGMAAAGGAAFATDKEPIKIGTFLSVTGPASFLGDPELKTLQHWVKRINDDGGVLGRPLKLVH